MIYYLTKNHWGKILVSHIQYMFEDSCVNIPLFRFMWGASSGIGREVALGLAREGAHVILASRSFQKLNTLAAEIESMGCSASVIMIDLSVKSSIDHFCRQLFSEHDSVNILINNASMINFEGRTVFAKEESFMTNHLGPFYLTHKLFTSLDKSGKPEEKSRTNMRYKPALFSLKIQSVKKTDNNKLITHK